jgi:hypothetical protein
MVYASWLNVALFDAVVLTVRLFQGNQERLEIDVG